MSQQQNMELKRYEGSESYFSEQVANGMANAEPVKTNAKACGKAIIVGEHAVVYGSTAVAMPLVDHRMHVRLVPTRTPDIRLILEGRELSHHLCQVIEDGMNALGMPHFGLKIEGHHSLPIGAGLGSSATLCIVVLRALSQSIGRKLECQELAKLGNILERRFHGNPSGLDTSVVAHEMVISFRKGAGATPIELSLPKNSDSWRFVLIDSGVRSSTMAMIKLAEPYFKSIHGDKRLAAFDDLGKQVIRGLADANEATVADAMNHACSMLTAAGVVNTELQTIIDQCLASGALAAKPTGAGGGGSILALFPSSEEAATNVESLRKALSSLKVLEVGLP